jgi:hypothetical protein
MVLSGTVFYPQEFLVEFGPLLSPEESFSISWREDKLICREGLTVTNQEEIFPSEDDWESFWMVLDEIGFWDWNMEYNLCAMEGTRWQVIIEFDDHEIHTSGRNFYPDNFSYFMEALEDLVSRELHFPP